MQYIIPNSINTENIRLNKNKLKNKKDYIYKIYYIYNSIELIGIPYKIKEDDYVQYEEKIVLKNKKDILSIKNLSMYIRSLFPDCFPLIDENNTLYHSRFLEKKKGDLYLLFSSINTYKNNKKAKIYFIYD